MHRADYEEAAANALATIAAAKKQLAQETHGLRVAQAQLLLQQVQLDAFEPLQLSGDEETAATVLAEVKAAAPESPDVVAFQAMLDLASRRPELLELAKQGKLPRLAKDDEGAAAVDATLQAAIAKHQNHAGLWLSQALWNQARHKTSAAIRCFNKAAKLRPNSVTAWLSSARMLREERMFDSALTRAQNGWLFNKDPRLLQEIALALVGLNRLGEAEDYLSVYVRLRPGDKNSAKILSNLLIGRALMLLSDHTKREIVRKLVADALRYNPDETKAHLVLGRLAHQEQKFERAVRHLEKAHQLLPTYDDAREQLTRSLAALGYAAFMNRLDNKATDAWLRCLEIASKDFGDEEVIRRQLKLAWGRIEGRGIEKFTAGKVAESIEDFRRLLKIDPENHWACWLIATAMQGDPNADLDELEALCRKAAAWQKKNKVDASRQSLMLAITLQRKGDEDAAQQIAEEYMQSPDQDADPAVLRALQRLADS
jgi:tetratricopeptide (TPR) repeat protein